MVYSAQEKAKCVEWFVEEGKSVAGFGIRYRREQGRNSEVPNRAAIKYWYSKFKAEGAFKRKKKAGNKWVRTEEKEAEVVDFFKAMPRSSVCWAANVEGMPSPRTIGRVLKESRFHPYKLQTLQTTNTSYNPKQVDRVKQVVHAVQMLDLIDNSAFLKNVFFSDEAHFHQHGSVNKQDFRYWAQENPHWYREEQLYSPRVTVWAAIGRRGVVGPFFVDKNVNGANYLRMLQQFFLPHVQGFQDVIFMQVGAPPHWSLAVRNWLDENFALRWMGRRTPASPAPFAWPPYSPDLTPYDFFLWGWIKSQVYTTPIANMNELRTRIERAFVSLPQQMINRAIEAYEKRLEYCLQVNGKVLSKNINGNRCYFCLLMMRVFK